LVSLKKILNEENVFGIYGEIVTFPL